MDAQTRYRVTGSLFLLAIAIICLPMIFDGEGAAPLDLPPLDLPAQTPDVTALNTVAPDSDVVARADELRKHYDDEGYSASNGSRVGEPVLTTPDQATRVWAVQVASFAESDNAVKLRDELREAGFEAFISSLRSEDGIMSRVAVGPLLSSEDASEMQKQLAKSVSTDTRVMAFSN